MTSMFNIRKGLLKKNWGGGEEAERQQLKKLTFSSNSSPLEGRK